MKNLVKRIALGSILLGSLIGCTKQPEYVEYQEQPLTRNEKLNRINWGAFDMDNDGVYDMLIAPHRDGVYGPAVYKKGGNDSNGELALQLSQTVIANKKEFSRMVGLDESSYILCRVDDFNGDGIADRISWPRLSDRMNIPIYQQPFPKEIQEKASEVVIRENFILDYISRK